MTLVEKLKEFVVSHGGLFVAGGFVVAAALRLIALAHPGLADAEAEQALQALAWSKGETIQVGGAPGYVGLTSFLFTLFGAGPFMARFWPALFGASLALVPWLYRKQIGPVPTVVLVYLVALNPGLIALSRSANGAMLAITCTLAAIGFLFAKKPILAGALLGVALVSGPLVWPLMITLSTAWFVTRRLKLEPDNGVEDNTPIYTKSDWVKGGISCLLSLGLVSTLFFTHPNGISGLGSGLSDYFRSWGQGGTITRVTLLFILLTAELPLLGFGLWGLLEGLKQKNALARFMGIWYLSGLILYLGNPSADVWSIVFSNLPLLVLAAQKLTGLFDTLKTENRIVLLVEAAAVISLSVFSAFNLLRLISFPELDPVYLRNQVIGVFLPLALLVAFTFLLAWGWDASATRTGLVIGFGLIFLGVLVGSAWKAAGWGREAENEFYTNQPVVTGDQAMLQTISDLSRWGTGVANRIDITLAGLTSPSVRWALRDFEKMEMDSTFPREGNASIVISNAESQLISQSAYRGQLVVWAIEPEYPLMNWTDWVKWGFIRSVPQKREYVMLWARNDLFKGSSADLISP